MNNVQKTIKEFLEGKILIIDFKTMYDKDSSIYDFLQNIIDEIKNKGAKLNDILFLMTHGLVVSF